MDNQMTSLKCRKCGASVSADQKKCPKCGAPILLKVMMEEEKRHLPAKEIREKDKRMRKEYEKMSKEKELEKQKAEKKQQLLDEKAKKAEEKAKKEQDFIREKEEKKAQKAEEKAKRAEEKAKKASVSEEKPEKSRKSGLIIGIILAVILFAAACTYAVVTMTQKEPVEPAAAEETETLTEETEIPEEFLDEPQEDAQEEQQEELPQEEPQETKEEPAKTQTRNITRNNYLFPSDTQYLTDADVNGLSKFDTGLIRNEIFARKGYVFKDEPYKSYFNSQAWYNPNPSVKNPKLNETEKYNVNFLLEYERSQGWR